MSIHEDLIITHITEQLAQLLQSATPEKMVAANKLLSEAMAWEFNITRFLIGAVQEAEREGFDDRIEKRLETQLNGIIMGTLGRNDALELATDIAECYRHEIVASIKHELEEDAYSAATATADIDPDLRYRSFRAL